MPLKTYQFSLLFFSFRPLYSASFLDIFFSGMFLILLQNFQFILMQDQSQAARLAEEYQRTISDLKSQLISANAECNRLVNEKQELSRKLQREELDKEQLIKVHLFFHICFFFVASLRRVCNCQWKYLNLVVNYQQWKVNRHRNQKQEMINN